VIYCIYDSPGICTAGQYAVLDYTKGIAPFISSGSPSYIAQTAGVNWNPSGPLPVGYVNSFVMPVSGGSGYAVNDTGTFSGCGDGTATYKVYAESGGVVSQVLITGGGTSGYHTVASCATTTTTGSGSGLTVAVYSWLIHNARIGKEGRYVAISTIGIGAPYEIIWDLANTSSSATQGTYDTIGASHKAQGYSTMEGGGTVGSYGPNNTLFPNLASANTVVRLLPINSSLPYYGPISDYQSMQNADPYFPVPAFGSTNIYGAAGTPLSLPGNGLILAVEIDQRRDTVWEFASTRTSFYTFPSPLYNNTVTVNYATGTTAYLVGDTGTLSGCVINGGPAATYVVTGVSTYVTGINITGNAANYQRGVTACTTTATSGTGSGLTVNTGPISVNAGGSSYAVNDTGTITGCPSGYGPTAPPYATYSVSSVSSGVVTGIDITYGAGGYLAGAAGCTTTTVTGSGSGLTLNISAATFSGLWNCFDYTPRGIVSQDGKYVAFTSVWEGQLGNDPFVVGCPPPRTDVFVVEITPLTPQMDSHVTPGSQQALFNTLAPDMQACSASVYSDAGRTNLITQSPDTIRDGRTSQILTAGLTPSTQYWTKLVCGGGNGTILSSFATRAPGSGTYQFPFLFPSSQPVEYCTNAAMTAGCTTLSPATSQTVPVAAGSVIYAKPGATGSISVLLTP